MEVVVSSAFHFVSKDILKHHVSLGEVSDVITNLLQDPQLSDFSDSANPHLSEDTSKADEVSGRFYYSISFHVLCYTLIKTSELCVRIIAKNPSKTKDEL